MTQTIVGTITQEPEKQNAYYRFEMTDENGEAFKIDIRPHQPKPDFRLGEKREVIVDYSEPLIKSAPNAFLFYVSSKRC